MPTQRRESLDERDGTKRYVLALIFLVVLGFFWTTVFIWIHGSQEKKKGLQPDERRELASRLMGVGLAEEATAQYEMYLQEAMLGSQDKSKIAFSVGKSFQDQGNLARALTWYYQAEILDPKSPLKAEIGSRIVECLEKLGKFQAAHYALESRSGMDDEEAGEKKGGEVVARIGDRSITLSEVDEALDKLPEWMRSQVQTPEQRVDFLKQYVTNELLYEKAVKLGYERDPAVQKQIDLLRKQLLVNRVVSEEVEGKVEITDSDVDLYYRANKDRYAEPASARLSMIKMSDRLEAEKARRTLKEGGDFAALAKEKSIDEATRENGGKISYPVSRGRDSLGLGKDKDLELWQRIEETEPGGITEVITSGDHFYLFQVHEKTSGRQKELNEVAEQVRQDITREKMGERYNEVMQSTLAAETVQLFPEVFLKDQTGKRE